MSETNDSGSSVARATAVTERELPSRVTSAVPSTAKQIVVSTKVTTTPGQVPGTGTS